VLVRRARELSLRYDLTRYGRVAAIAALLIFLGNSSLQTAVADGDTRTLSFHHAHSGEDITVTFKRNGRYDDDALKKLNWFMRDWRKDEQVEMDPRLFDVLWETYREVGGRQPIQVICGYRSPETNSMLRRRSSGVAEMSLHTKGDAMDFFIPGVPLEKIREVGLRLQRGGVGFYPTSGSPFVHLDTGSIRHWPRMTHDQLVKVFPDGRTVHVPSDGQPLANYALALADVERQGQSPSSLSLAAARNSGLIDDNEERAAAQPGSKSLIAGLFGFGKSEPKSAALPVPLVPVAPAPPPIRAASLASPNPVNTVAIIPMPKLRPATPVQIAAHVPTPKQRPALPVEIASADPVVTATTGQALAYAAEAPAPSVSVASAKPMGVKLPKMAPASVMKNEPAAKALASALPSTPVSGPIALGDNPWLRAAILAPNATNFLSTTPAGTYDTLRFAEFVKKPSSAVMMSFSADPLNGLSTERFSGSAVVFVATATFGTRTAALK
jgi:uncharacterized protein YcbK (DUF882 family)